MTVKEFDVGQTVFILNMHEGRNREPEIREATVKTVGRKYVTIGNEDRYESEESIPFGLIQNIDYGDKRLLFPSRTDVNNYIEQSKLAKWISSISWTKSRKFDLEQLRKVKEILGD